ncbi:NADH-quinone oxidoreductase subunit L [uncultured Alphaproteobacteria bacterium]|uniref:NADH-ubiquinone oxidoreductase chain 5 n=1 Tax=uncultured Alphaproteobacteria bacterium TaxID=91750 RepID=A0A212J8P6_9PROT|nr:NADH-quinone oxidoreductase subunit L [uncultured Alphaproteobacteria bacterium]
MTVAIVFLPLLGAILAGLFGRFIGRVGAQAVTSLLMLVSAGLSAFVLYSVGFGPGAYTVTLFDWIHVGSFDAVWALKVDTLTAAMLFTVSTVSALVHVYSIGYMHGDPSEPRFMAYLSLFTFFMLMLVTADNLVQLFFGWEGVGLSSYLLIGFWNDRPAANAAAIKAFVVNRVGDFGFMLGIAGIYLAFDSAQFDTIFAAAPEMAGQTFRVFGAELPVLTTLCLLLFVGAMGKSAQIGLHTWLPDAMEGPTPVSALIHAATMVTAGVFMVARMSPLFEYSDTALAVVAFVGATTALFAATVGCVQNDIKRVIAYSTCSQLGYMFFALGVGAYGAAIFHLVTHAFFKAMLFLGAGSVIHAMSDEQDMRRMGGIWRNVKFTYAIMWIGSLSLAGLPVFAGYYSKDTILEAAWGAHSAIGQYAFWMGAAAALLTAFYSWRLLFMTFHGQPRADEKTMAHVHESPPVMLVPLMALAVGAIFAGMIGYDAFVGEGRAAFWKTALAVVGADPLEAAHHVPPFVKMLPIAVAGAGILVAYLFYIVRTDVPGRLAAAMPGLHRFLLNKWYFDELYEAVFVRPAFALGRLLWKKGDVGTIDRFGPDGVSFLARAAARRTALIQSGFIYHYAFAMIIGLVVFVSAYVAGLQG